MKPEIKCLFGKRWFAAVIVFSLLVVVVELLLFLFGRNAPPM
jgi:hypothetical protein